MYYPSSENKGADQLRGYREADLCLCFRLCRLLVFPWGGSFENLSLEFQADLNCAVIGQLICVMILHMQKVGFHMTLAHLISLDFICGQIGRLFCFELSKINVYFYIELC